ncbi:AarF/UbiB family protein [Streptomyces olivoreticuli]
MTSAAGRRFALKCFTREVGDQETRYREISKKLAKIDAAKLSQPWKMGFDYLPDGILVGAERFPLLKMEWVDGISLSAWLDNHHTDRSAVAGLANRFAGLTADLATAGIAHGDLQHGNLLVSDDGSFRLVDYDGMYVPALRGLPGTENGHRNYQSPRRAADDFGPAMDRFSAWVIYLSLVALAAEPGLWGQLHEEGGEYLLLSEDDFKSPDNSSRLPVLLHHADSVVRDLATRFRSLAAQPLSALPDLEISAKPAHIPVQPLQPKAPASALPQWMEGHIVDVGGKSTLAPANGFRGRTPMDSAAALLPVLSVLVPVLLFFAEVLTSATFLLAFVSALAVSGAFARYAHRARPESRGAAEELRALKELEAAATGLSKARADIDRERIGLDRAEVSRAAELKAKQQKITQKLQKKHAGIESDRSREERKLTQQLAGLSSRHHQELSRALDVLQRQHIQQHLTKCGIAYAKLHQFGPKTVADLAAHGIRTAADFTGTRLVATSSTYGSTTAHIVLAGGREVNVKGIGAQKAATLEAWRHDCEAHARRNAPVLSPQERSRIANNYAVLETGLKQELKDLATAAQRRRDEAAQETAKARSDLLAEDRRAQDAARRQKAVLDQRWSDAAHTVAVGRSALVAARQSAAAQLEAVSGKRYVRFLYLGDGS